MRPIPIVHLARIDDAHFAYRTFSRTPISGYHRGADCYLALVQWSLAEPIIVCICLHAVFSPYDSSFFLGTPDINDMY